MEHNDANLPNSRETDSIPNPRETDSMAQTRSRYGRIIKQTTRMIESHKQARTKKNHNIALCSSSEDYNKSLHVKHNEITNSLENPMTFISQVGDTMHLHQAMKQPDRAKFLKLWKKKYLHMKEEDTGRSYQYQQCPTEQEYWTLYGQ